MFSNPCCLFHYIFCLSPFYVYTGYVLFLLDYINYEMDCILVNICSPLSRLPQEKNGYLNTQINFKQVYRTAELLHPIETQIMSNLYIIISRDRLCSRICHLSSEACFKKASLKQEENNFGVS